jgi:hypothetical protein
VGRQLSSLSAYDLRLIDDKVRDVGLSEYAGKAAGASPRYTRVAAPTAVWKGISHACGRSEGCVGGDAEGGPWLIRCAGDQGPGQAGPGCHAAEAGGGVRVKMDGTEVAAVSLIPCLAWVIPQR